jgi:hypothetical protein
MMSALPPDSISSSVRPVHSNFMPGIMFWFGKVLHGRQALAGAVAGRGRAVDLDGAEEVVVADDRRARSSRQGDQVVERNHLAGVGAHVEAVQIARRSCGRAGRPAQDAIGAVVVVEVVDVLRAHEDAEVVVICESGMFIALAFSRSMVTSTCGIVGGEGGERPVRSLRVRRAHDLVGHAVEVAEGVAALVLEHELEAAEAAHAVDGGRLEECHEAAVGGIISKQLGRRDRPRCRRRSGPCRGADRRAWWRRTSCRVGRAAGEAEAHDGEGADDIGFWMMACARSADAVV